MICGEPSQSIKIPLKSCDGSVIEHSLVTLQLGLEWPDRGGDEPNLLISIKNKNLASSTSFREQNKFLPSISVSPANNSPVDRRQQNNFSTLQPQFHHQHILSMIDFDNQLNSPTAIPLSDLETILSNTSTDLFNPVQSETSSFNSSTTIQVIGRQSQSQSLPNYQCQMTGYQQAIHTPTSINMNDSSTNIQKTTISFAPLSTIQPISPIATHVDAGQTLSVPYSSSILTDLSSKRIICICSNPRRAHDNSCPARVLRKSFLDTTLTTDGVYQPSLNDQTIAHRISFCSQVRSNDSISTFSNTDPIQSTGNSPNVTTIISQKAPESNTDNNIQQQAYSFSQITSNNLFNNQSMTSVFTLAEGKNTMHSSDSHKKKQTQAKQISSNLHNLSNQKSNVNDSQLKGAQTNNDFSDISLNTRQIEPRSITFQEHSQSKTTLSSENTLHDSTNNINKPNEFKEDFYTSKSSVRSPVRLDILMPQNLMKTEIGSPEIDQTISDVVKGKGEISIRGKLTPASRKDHKKKQPLLTQLVWESSGSTTSEAHLSTSNQLEHQSSIDSSHSTLNIPSVHCITPPSNRSPMSGEATKDIQFQGYISADNAKKRERSTPNNDMNSKRRSASNINAPLSASSSSSPIDVPSTITTSPITPQIQSAKKIISWSTTSTAPSSSISDYSTTTAVTTTTAMASTETSSQNADNNAWPTPTIHHDISLTDSLLSENEHEHLSNLKFTDTADIVDYLMKQSDNHDNFIASTPPPPPPPPAPSSSSSITILTSITSEVLTPNSVDKSSTTSEKSFLNTDDVYENFFTSSFPTNGSPDLSEHEIISERRTSPRDIQDNHSLQQHYNTQIDMCLNSAGQLQNQIPKVMDTKTSTSKSTNTNHTLAIGITHKQQHAKVQSQKPLKKLTHKKQLKSSKDSSNTSKQKMISNQNIKKSETKFMCSRCGQESLLDITHHEFPKQKGLLFECVSCGNNSIRSNVSNEERERRKAKVVADHLTKVTCQFCRKIFYSHNDYLSHLKNDHASDKPM